MISQQFNFSGGEWSPLLADNANLEAYFKALKVEKNLLPTRQGPPRSRPGTEFIALAKYPNRRARLEPFVYSTTTAFVLELGHYYARFFSNGLPVTVDGVPVEVITPYSEDEIFDVQFAPEKDVIYFAHPDHLPQRLTRLSDTTWEWVETPFSAWPFESPNTVTGKSLAANAKSGAGVILTAAESIFQSAHAGSRIRISHRRSQKPVSIPITGNGSSDPLFARGEVTIQTSGTWTASILLEQSFNDGATWEKAYQLSAHSDRNHETVVAIDTRSLVRLTVADYQTSSGPVDPVAYLIAADSWHEGVCKIDSVLSGTQANVTVETALFSTDATDYWAFAAWSDANGYPAAIELHENRLWYGFSRKAPLFVWGSSLGDFERIEDGVYADDAMLLDMASRQGNRILWLRSYQNSLFIGTTASEWTLQTRTDGEVLSPTNFQFQLRSSYGSAGIPAIQAGDSLLFVLRSGKEVRDLTYVYERDAYTGLEVSDRAEHLLVSGIRQMAYATAPERLNWFITVDGMAVSFAYEKDSNLVAWQRQTTRGSFESVAPIPTATGGEVWFLCSRTVAGESIRTIERFHPSTDGAVLAGNGPYLLADCGTLRLLESPATVFSGFGHLEGETLSVCADGATRNSVLVIGGNVTLDRAAKSWVAFGLPYTQLLETLPLAAPLEMGSTLGRICRAHRLAVSVLHTRGLQHTTFGADAQESEWFTAYARGIPGVMDAAPPLFTGIYDLTAAPRIARAITISLRQTQPQPLCILSLSVEWDKLEKTT